ncbi:MAG TPA: right-handed parallel beta-helix repeat-containing protein [Pyrinomonadaceae bacterium]|jgi:hypothetical protein
MSSHVIRHSFKALALVTFALLAASAAQAQATRTWVSGVGSDANPCSRTAPCKTYAGAISKTAMGGEISTLDPGGYGAITITKSITINGTPGSGYGSILASSGVNGVVVNITDPADTKKTVRLNWLDINGAGPSLGANGVRFIAGAALHIENTVIDGFAQKGVDVNISNLQSAPAKLYMKNVTVRNCAGDGVSITHANAGSVVIASLLDVSAGNCANGVNMGARSRATIRGGTFHANTTAGVNLTGVGNAEASLMGCTLTNNPTGVIAGGAPNIARLAQTMIYGNTTSLTGNVKGWAGNFIDGNTNNNLPLAPNLP